MERPFPEFLPRFDMAYRRAHEQFRENIESGIAFSVTQNKVLDAQVFVEAAHCSAQSAGARYRMQRCDDLPEYKAACIANGLISITCSGLQGLRDVKPLAGYGFFRTSSRRIH